METTTQEIPFIEFPKLARAARQCHVTEKIDGTNAQVFIGEDGTIKAGSRNRWITPTDDNFGFAAWVEANRDELLKLGPGRHYGEWWGHGIQRGYSLPKGERRFSLFNVARWSANPVPSCCHVVPELYRGLFSSDQIDKAMALLREAGSFAAPGFMKPEGIVCFHVAANMGFKKTLENDESPKSLVVHP